jgi:hypothetical protein
MRALTLIAVAAIALAAPAAAQTYVGENIEGGLHWSVSAPGGASWRLNCRFPPVTYYRNNYDREAWINQLTDEGSGPSRGRMPLDTGHCRVTKTGGEGPVAIAVGRPGNVETAVARAVGESATAGLF